MTKTIQYFAQEAQDPLVEEAIDRLLAHSEEDSFVDYKQTFDPSSEKQWLNLAIDGMAFANTFGGFLVFGVTDGSFELVGVSESVVNALCNTNLLLQKFNRHVLPKFQRIRARKAERDGKQFVVIFIPETKGDTHIVVKEGAFQQPSGEKKIVLRPGMIFVRRSASNHVVDPTDLDFIINRRIEHYGTSILDKIARVIAAPPKHEILVVDPRSTQGEHPTFVISDAPDALPVKGLSFTISPKTDEEEISGWKALCGKDREFLPRKAELWRLYAKRHDLSLTENQKKAMAQFCLLSEVPAFFWLQEIKPSEVKATLLEAVSIPASMNAKDTIVRTGAFMGKTFHGKLINKLGQDADRLSPSTRNIPTSGAKNLFHLDLLTAYKSQKSQKTFHKTLEEELTELSINLSKGVGGVMKRITAAAMDCYLYTK